MWKSGLTLSIPLELETYCLADEAIVLLGMSHTTLSRWEAAGRTIADYSHGTRPEAGDV